MRERNLIPPHSNGEVSASYADGGGMSPSPAAYEPSIRFADTFPSEWGGRLSHA